MFKGLHPPTIIAFGTLISVLAVVFYAFLYPVRAEIADLKEGQKAIETKFERKFEKMDGKLDRILAHPPQIK